MKDNNILVFIFFMCLMAFQPTRIYSQLEGMYTVGGVSPDYLTAEEAFTSLHLLGSSDTVIFLIRDGIYYFSTFNQNINSQFPVYFKSENIGSPSVIFKTLSNPFRLNYCSNLHFSGIEFKNESTGNCMEITNSSKFSFNLCTFYSSLTADFVFKAASGSDFSIVSCIFDERVVELSSNSGVRLIQKNVFKGKATLGVCDSLSQNQFYDNVSCTPAHAIGNNMAADCYIATPDFSRNHVQGRCDLTSSKKVSENIIHEICTIDGVDAMVINNHFFHAVYITSNHSMSFLYNNVKEDFLYIETQGQTNVVNNNLPALYFYYYINSLSIIRSNNFFPGYCPYGEDIYHIDPRYFSPDSLLATNGLLVGKGYHLVNYTTDIESNTRNLCPTIGANEFYLGDTVTMSCSEDLVLSFDFLDTTLHTTYTPNLFIIDSILGIPVIQPETSQWYFISDSTGVLDSVFVDVHPFTLEMPAGQEIYCGDYALLYYVPQPYNEFLFSWAPGDNVLFYEDYSFYGNPEISTTFVLTCIHPQCGVFSDSISISVLPYPIADGYTDSIFYHSREVSFFNASHCESEVVWYFGDGEHTAEENPVHCYKEDGVYDWMLIVHNDYGGDINFGSVSIHTALSTPSVNGFNQFTLFPNPATDNVQLELPKNQIQGQLEIYTMIGQLLQSEEIKQNCYTIDISNLPPGTFLCKLFCGENIYQSNLVIVAH